PVGYSQSDATFKGVHPELEEAGRILGAGRLRVLGEITAPLARSGIIATWCFVFIGVIRELSASIILFTPNTKVISVVITLVLGVKRMIDADSSRITPMKTKHQVAMMPLRASGAVISPSTRRRPAPRMRPASSSSGWTPLKVASD